MEWAKSYYLPRHFKSFGVYTRSICTAYGMDLLTLETSAEADHFLGLCQENAHHFDSLTHVGGMALEGKSLNTWYWLNSGKEIVYPLKFAPGQPDNFNDTEYCLSIMKSENGFLFNDVNCNDVDKLKFICQF